MSSLLLTVVARARADSPHLWCSATKLIAKTKEREALNAAAKEEEEGEADEGGEGIEIEGLETREDESGRREPEPVEEEEEEYEEDEEFPQPVRRRPVIEYQ